MTSSGPTPSSGSKVMAKVTGLSVAVNWTNDVTYSSINFEADATVVLGAFK